ncbi:Glutamate carboxypeptidase 2-like protein [Dirofilaria immitis]|nr:Glutamate carboxypeptidase 2-like protein [Dirofilaria immitis]
MEYCNHTATASTSLSTASVPQNLIHSALDIQNYASESLSCHAQNAEHHWLLLNGKDQQSFNSCIAMECNYNWKNATRNEQKLYHDNDNDDNNNNDTLYQVINQKSNMEISMTKSKTKISMAPNSSLVPLLLCIVLIFFMVITILLIMVIFLSTQRNITTNRWNAPLNVTFTYPDRIYQNLEKKIHVAGTIENAELMRRIAEKYRRYEYDVKTYSYNVLLNYPNYEKPNQIELHIGDKKWKELSNGLAQRLGPKEAQEQQADPRSLVYWAAYSRNGTVTGPIVYVNYGTTDDYKRLDKYGISLKGKIVLCRYGAIFRGDKVQLAVKHGAIGMILYSDPFDYTNGRNNLKVFPNEIWLPESGAQRGTLLKTDGDPETPLLPSKYYTYRTETEENLRERQIMPSIPVMPIGYRDARKIMENLDGTQIKWHSWIGSMNVTYRFTGSAKFRVTVNSASTRRIITNIIATMFGREEPDRYVLFSNHYDAWVKGAIDPISATGTMLEMALRSTEWVEEFMKPLQQRAIAVINVDNINGDTSLSVKAVPLLYRVIVNAAAKVPSPNMLEREAERMTLLDSWKFYDPKGPITGDRSIPSIGIPGTGSDFQRFITYLGIPVIDMKLESAPLYTYMLYHTMYEIPWLLDNFLDQNYTALLAVGQLWLEIGRDLADSLIIPFNLHDYGLVLSDFIDRMDQQLEHIGIPKAIGIKAYRIVLNNLRGALRRFQIVANVVQQITQSVNTGHESISIKQAEMLNNRMQYIERAFITEQGIYPERSEFRHLIFTSNSIRNDYGNLLFGGILDPALQWYNASVTGNLNNANYWLKRIKIGFAKLHYGIESAILILNMDGYYDL